MLEHVANNAVVEGFKFGICWANRAVLDNWKAVCSITQTQDDASAEREAISDQLSKALGVKPPRSAGDEEEKKQEAEVASGVLHGRLGGFSFRRRHEMCRIAFCGLSPIVET